MPTVIVGLNTGDDYASGTSNELAEQNPTTVAAGTNFYVSTYSASDERHGLLTFDLAALPTGQVVSSARLARIVTDHAGTNINMIQWRRVLRTINTAQVTWNVYSTGNSWGTAGGKADGTDRDADVSFLGPDSSTPSLDYRFFDATSDGRTDIANAMGVGVISWLAQRANTNATEYINFGGSSGTDSVRPYLEITYAAGGGGAAIPAASAYYRRLRA
jgi:hypothetical protein